MSSSTVESGSQVTSSGLFARNATGLVREVRPLSSLIINYIPGCPAQVLAAGFFFAFALYPGGNFPLALLLTLPLTLAFAYAFGLLTTAIPRSGGDYMLVSRILHPAVGLLSSLCSTASAVLSTAFFGIAFVTFAVGPGLIIVGLVGGDHTFVEWGNTVLTNKNWQFGLGAVMMIAAAFMMAGGWGWTLRLQAILFTLVMAGLLACVVIALFTSRDEFIHNFNVFAKPITGKADTYHNVIATAQKAGVNTAPKFSFAQTIPIIGVVSGFSIYSWWTAFIGGELRQARSIKTAHRMALAGFLNLATVGIFAVIFLHTFGTAFMTAANGGGMPSQIGSPPYYFFLISASTGSAVLAVFLVVSFAVFWPLITYIQLLQPTRSLFAWAFDGLLPRSVTSLSKGHSPYIAVIIATVANIVTLYWGLHASNFFQVLVYAVLFQVIAMILVGLSATVFPRRRPELYRAAATQRRVLGVPLVSIAGVGAVLGGLFLFFLYFHYDQLGLVGKGKFFAYLGVIIAIAAVYYTSVKAYRARGGVDLSRAVGEIPPE